MNNVNLENISNDLNIKTTEGLANQQNNAISEILNNVINWSIDEGIRYILPDSIENEVIKVKNDILNGKMQQKITGAIENIINFGKEKINNEKKEISNVEDIEKILKSPDTIKVLSETIEKILEGKNLNNIGSKDLNDKSLISKNIEDNLNSELEKQINSINKIENYKVEWYKNFDNKDFEAMNKTYKNIKKEFKNIIPLENNIKEIRKIENLNELVKSKGGDFNITKEELELANKLI